MPAPYLVAIAGSSGALSVIRMILGALPASLDAALVIVLHRMPDTGSLLTTILERSTSLRVKDAHEGDVLESGTVYVAPPDRHVVVTKECTLHLWNGRRIRRVKSSANPLFESAAEAYGDRALAIVLSGYDADGTNGVQAIAEHGGVVAVQDPRSSFAPDMPRTAILSGAVTRSVPAELIAAEVMEFIAARRRSTVD